MTGPQQVSESLSSILCWFLNAKFRECLEGNDKVGGG